MITKTFFAAIATGYFCALATPSSAVSPIGMPVVAGLATQSYLTVIQMMESNGYRVVSMKSTLLGRVKIRVRNPEHLREVVVSRSTGEIKSDRIVQVFSNPGISTSAQTSDGQESTGSGGTGVGVSTGGASVSAGSGGVSAGVGGASVSIGLGG